MGIQRGQHAVDCAFDQFLVVGGLDIVFAHTLENVAEDCQLPVGVTACCIGCRQAQQVGCKQRGTGAEKGTDKQ